MARHWRRSNAVRPLRSLARLDLDDRNVGSAVTLLERAASHAPDDGGVMSDLGQALVEQFNRDRANSNDERLSHVRTVLARAWELNADDASISGLLGLMLLYQPHDPAHAREALEAAVRLAPSNDTYRRRRSGRHAQAAGGGI